MLEDYREYTENNWKNLMKDTINKYLHKSERAIPVLIIEHLLEVIYQ